VPRINNIYAKDHLRLISKFHIEAKEYKFPINKGIKNNLGKTIEEYKVDIKKAGKYLEKNKELLDKNAEIFLKRAEDCVKLAEKSHYIDLIKRSMTRSEICIGNNIPLNTSGVNEIFVMNIEDCSYDLIEMDGILYLSKLKRKGIKLNYKKLIKWYCQDEGLGLDSEKFMLALLSYPREFLKCIERYRLNKREWTEDEFISNIEQSFKKDGISLIGVSRSFIRGVK